MTTVADVRKIVAPLLAAHDDLVLVGRMLAIKPVHHILRGVHLDRARRTISSCGGRLSFSSTSATD